MDFATGPEPLRSGSEILSFLARPEAEVEYHAGAQRQRSFGDLPLQSLDEAVSRVVLRIRRILSEEAHLPLVGREAECRVLRFESTRQRGLSRAGKTDHEMQRCHRHRSSHARRGAGELGPPGDALLVEALPAPIPLGLGPQCSCNERASASESQSLRILAHELDRAAYDRTRAVLRRTCAEAGSRAQSEQDYGS